MGSISIKYLRFMYGYYAMLLVFLLYSTDFLDLKNISKDTIFDCSIKKNNLLSSKITSLSKISLNTFQNIYLPVIAQVRMQPTKMQKFRLSKHIVSTQIIDKNIKYNRTYKNIIKGTYKGSNKYTVKYGDTLFYIAWITGNNFINLAKKNNILFPYVLNIGQILQVDNKTHLLSQKDNNTSKVRKKLITKNNQLLKTNKASVITSKDNVTKKHTKDVMSNLLIPIWHWPAVGRIIEHFSFSEVGNKGIDIAGYKGQSIYATADGRVVYAGNAIRGYGNLIIIKHNDNYLSAYAHNEMLLVQEKQQVKSGQKIATMGNTGTSTTRLHFEIRYKGKSVNPLHYLSLQ